MASVNWEKQVPYYGTCMVTVDVFGVCYSHAFAATTSVSKSI